MARGKNYVNNNRGVALQSHGRKGQDMQACKYGAACQRKDCMYRHPPAARDASSHDDAPSGAGICMAYLAGNCTFGRKGCNKRHPSKEEGERLRSKYKSMSCRFGDDCHTEGCLYKHPRDKVHGQDNGDDDGVAFIDPSNHFPPLLPSTRGSINTSERTTPKPQQDSISAWKSTPVGVFSAAGPASAAANAVPSVTTTTTAMSTGIVAHHHQQQQQQQQQSQQHGSFVYPTETMYYTDGGASMSTMPTGIVGYPNYHPQMMYNSDFVGDGEGMYYHPDMATTTTMMNTSSFPSSWSGMGSGPSTSARTSFNAEAKEFIPSSAAMTGSR